MRIALVSLHTTNAPSEYFFYIVHFSVIVILFIGFSQLFSVMYAVRCGIVFSVCFSSYMLWYKLPDWCPESIEQTMWFVNAWTLQSAYNNELLIFIVWQWNYISNQSATDQPVPVSKVNFSCAMPSNEQSNLNW